MNAYKTATVSGYAPVNGLQMYYEVYGETGTPLVLVHGGGSTIETSFGYLLPLLARQHKVIAVELQAHGRTSDRNGPETFEQDADDVAALLQHLNILKADLLGFSNGGSTVMQMAIRHPGLVLQIIVIAGAYKREGLITGFFEGMQHAQLDNMPLLLQKAYEKVAPDKKLLQVMFDKDKARMLQFEDWPDDLLQQINKPALLMVADRDVITVDHTLQMSRVIPGARLVVLPGTHGSFIRTAESPDASNDSEVFRLTVALILSFLQGTL